MLMEFKKGNSCVKNSLAGLLLFFLAASSLADQSSSEFDRGENIQFTEFTSKDKKLSTKRYLNLLSRAHYLDVENIHGISERVKERLIELVEPSGSMFTIEELTRLKAIPIAIENIESTGDLQNLNNLLNQTIELLIPRYLKLLEISHKVSKSSKSKKQIMIEKSHFSDEQTLLNYWRMKMATDVQQLLNLGLTESNIKSILSKRFSNKIDRLKKLAGQRRYHLMSNSLVGAYDPHSQYIDPNEFTLQELQLNQTHNSAGNAETAHIGFSMWNKNGQLLIKEVLEQSDAALKGIKVGMEALALIENEQVMGIAGAGNPNFYFDQYTYGKEGNEVDIIVRTNTPEQTIKKFSITRQTIKTQYSPLQSEVIKLKENAKSIGLITLSSFYNEVSKDAQKILKTFSSQGIDTLIVDLRNNGGGSLVESAHFSGLFMKGGPVFQVRYSTGRISVLTDEDEDSYFSGTVFVLVNGRSAGSSEIFAAAMQDFNRGIIIGEQTHGLGTVRQHRGLTRQYDFIDEPLGSIQFTIAKYYRSTGAGIQKIGVFPDIDIDLFDSGFLTREKDVKYTLEEDSIDRARKYQVPESDLEMAINKLREIQCQCELKDKSFQDQALECVKLLAASL